MLAYLTCGPDESGFFDPEDLGKAVAFLAAVAVLWFLASLFLRKKGKPLPLPPLFWIVAGIPVAFLLAFSSGPLVQRVLP
ncbi:MAG: hypothetical protein QM691_10055 [Opitutaceae bacterium]